jgi:hypothetical protein
MSKDGRKFYEEWKKIHKTQRQKARKAKAKRIAEAITKGEPTPEILGSAEGGPMLTKKGPKL